jgi:hypothetical protein
MPGLPVSPALAVASALSPAIRVDLLREEYFKLQDIVESFDERALQIKGWSVTVSLAGMAAAIVANIEPTEKALAFFIAAMGAIAFWWIEFFWKCFQWTFFHRIDAIEAAFAGDRLAEENPLQIRNVFHANFKRDLLPNLPKALKPSLMFPHLLVATMGLGLSLRYSGLLG